jgi:acyl-CoA reductase-like NAD-dependent aldehyde dehydrogenase
MIDDTRINQLVQQVMAEVRAGQTPIVPPTRSGAAAPPVAAGVDGVFADVDGAVAAAHTAFDQLNALPLDLRDRMITAMRHAAEEAASVLAHEAWTETGMGRYEDKVEKNLLNARKALGTEDLKTGAWSGDHGLTITEYAPYGVIGALTPSTNPTSTVICNSINMVAAGNAVVFGAHPSAQNCTAHAVQILNRAIQSVGGPKNLLTTLAEPTIEKAQAIMAHKQVRLLTVTGGSAVVKQAMSSGKRAVCAGPGNPPVVVDETADIEQAGRDIVRGASFDNNIVCTTEKETFVVESVGDALIKAMCAHGAVQISSWQLARLCKAIFEENRGPGKPGVMNKRFIGQNAGVLLKQIGIDAGPEVRLIVAAVDRDHPLIWSEQMMPVMPVCKVRSVDEAIDLAIRAEHGFHHTAMMHSKNLDALSRMARDCNCSIFVKNGPCLAGLGYGGEGFCSFTIASPTGEGITSPRSFSRIRRCTLVDAFRIV